VRLRSMESTKIISIHFFIRFHSFSKTVKGGQYR